MMRIRIIQNCYTSDQKEGCSFEPYLNETPQSADEKYLFFESEVIRKLVVDRWHEESDFFGVLGYRWQEKLVEATAPMRSLPIRNLSRDVLTPQAVLEFVSNHSEADFLSLGQFIPHPVFRFAETFHAGILEATKKLLEANRIRFDPRMMISQPIYFNSFVARSEAIGSFVREILDPVIRAATEDSELRRLCLQNSGYFRSFRPELARLYGISYYPLHPFIGERLINLYTMESGARVVSFDRSARTSRWTRMASAFERSRRSIAWHWLSKEGWRM
jgi:hypothetical protein